MKMKKSRLFPSVLAFACILGVYGVAFGGYDPSSCGQILDLYPPTSGPFITGTFTVSMVIGYLGDYNYDVHFVLHHRTKVHIFSYTYPLQGYEPSLCDLTADDIKNPELFPSQIPCKADVGTPFGLNGTPVIKDVFILKKESCGPYVPCSPCDPYSPYQMIHGLITIRVVPTP
jgi:hypothetical protein